MRIKYFEVSSYYYDDSYSWIRCSCKTTAEIFFKEIKKLQRKLPNKKLEKSWEKSDFSETHEAEIIHRQLQQELRVICDNLDLTLLTSEYRFGLHIKLHKFAIETHYLDMKGTVTIEG